MSTDHDPRGMMLLRFRENHRLQSFPLFFPRSEMWPNTSVDKNLGIGLVEIPATFLQEPDMLTRYPEKLILQQTRPIGNERGSS